MGDPWGIGGFRGGGEPNIKQIVKKKIGQKISKIDEIGKKSEKIGFFFYWKWSKMHYEPHETTLKVNNLSKKKKNIKLAKSGKNRIFFTENGLKCIRNPTKHL